MAVEKTLTLYKKGHTYLFRYTPRRDDAVILEAIIRKGDEPEKSGLNAFDAAVLASQVMSNLTPQERLPLKALQQSLIKK